MNEPAISCVVPTLNSAATLEATLHSLRSQRGVRLEILVADSGSTDETLAICRRWDAPTIFVPPGNMYRAINAGLKQMKGEWAFYLNSDDLIFEDSLARLIGAGRETDVCYGNCDYLDFAGRFVYSFCAARPENLLPLFRLRRMGFAQQTAIYRRSLFDELGGFDETLRYRADADFFIRALLRGRRFRKLNGPSVACFRLHGNQFSNRGLAETEAEAERIFGRPELRPGWRDRATTIGWQINNIPHYLIRILRESTLSDRLRLPRAIEPYSHD
jgi:glycosyltransferase involved in cell wall biosynthesis